MLVPSSLMTMVVDADGVPAVGSVGMVGVAGDVGVSGSVTGVVVMTDVSTPSASGKWCGGVVPDMVQS